MINQNIIRLMNLGIKRVNSKEDFEIFQSFITQELDLDTIYSMIDKKLKEEDGPTLLEYILIAFSVKPDSQNVMEQLYNYVMNAINTTEIPEQIKVHSIKRLSWNLYNLSSDSLITFINMCKKDIDDTNEKSMQSWKELIPQILKIISESKVLLVGGLEITGAEFKEMIITDICSKTIKRNIIVPVAVMLGRTPLTEKERELAITSLCLYFDEMKPQEIPNLLRPIINVCKSENYIDVFRTLQKYFDDKYIVSCYNEENKTFPIGDAEQKELLKAQSTVLSLLEDFAKHHSSFVDTITKYIKNCISAPNMVFGPFMLAFLLNLSESFKANSIILMKMLVTQLMLQVKNNKRSFWLKINCSNIYDIYTEIQIFINSNITSNEKVVRGLIHFGLSLLDTSSIHKKDIDVTNKMHQLGIFIIVILVNNKGSFVPENLLQTMTDSITCNPSLNQYIECVRLLCKSPKPSVVEQIIDFLKLFGEISVGLSNKIICAIMPVLKISECLRDNVIIVLRKELMSKNLPLKRGAVLGFIEILCSICVEENSSTSLSQSTNSQDSWSGLFNQVLLNKKSIDIQGIVNPNNTMDNKSYCLEILNILKTCFLQKSEIKKTLYRGLIRVMSHNSGLCINTNNWILNHMQSWCIRVTDNKKSLKFNKSIVEDGIHKKLISHEPLEELILLAQHISAKNIAYEHRRKCTDEVKILLGKLVNFYSECNLFEIYVNESTTLLDVITNISHYSEFVKQVLCVYQVFMVYVVNTWSSPVQDKECLEKLHRLFSKYNYLVEAIEASNKINQKKDKEQKSETYKFIVPYMNLDFDDLYKFLSLLSTNVNWASDVAIAPLKRNAKLWEFVLKLIKAYLFEIESLIFLDEKPLNIYGNLCTLSKLLYNHFFFDIDKNIRFSPVVVELGIECYLKVIKFVSSNYKKLDIFLLESNQQTTIDSSQEIFNVLGIMRSNLDKVLEMNQVEDAFDIVDDKVIYDKIEYHLIGCVSVMCNTINQNQDARMENILIWLSTAIEKYAFANINNSKVFLTLMLDMHTANQEDPVIITILIQKLCFFFGEINKTPKVNELQLKQLNFITDLNINMICSVLCKYLSKELNYAFLCLSQLKAEFNISQKKTKKKSYRIQLKSKESAICNRITLVISKMISFTKSMVPRGENTDSVFKLLYNIYHIVNGIIKHFLVRSSYEDPVYKEALFGKLYETINQQLTPNVTAFIMFVENGSLLLDHDKKFIELMAQKRRKTSYIPKVVTEIDLFVTSITELGNKCKDENLTNVYKLTTNGDFILNLPILQGLFSKKNDSEESDSELEGIRNQSSASKTVDPPKKKRKFHSSASSSDSSRSTSPVF